MKAREYKLIDEYFDLIKRGHNRGEPITDAPDIYHLFSFLTVIGALLEKRTFIYYSSKRVYPNLWVVLVGKSSLFRKSTSISLALKLVERTNNSLLLPTEFSLEKLFEILSTSPIGLFQIDEFSNFFHQFHRSYMSGGTSFFLQLYENDITIRRYLREGEYEIKYPCLSILSATTLEGISESLKEREIRTGLLPRFNFVVALKKEKEIAYPDILSFTRFSDLVEKLKKLLSEQSGTNEKKLREGAVRTYTDFVKDKSEKLRNTELGPFLTRIFTTILKLSLIFSFLGRKNFIDREDMEASCECGNVLIKSAEVVLNQLCWTPFQEKRKKVIEAILEYKQDWISRTDLIRKTRLSSSELNSVIKTLLDEDLIEFDRRKGVNEKKPIIYYKIKEEEIEKV